MRQSPKILRKPDNAPLTRIDLQYDLLHSIFSDENEVFTDPFPCQFDTIPPRSRVTFRNLYVNAVMNSPKASKLLKDKMLEIPEFATHFAMLSLLTNVGRINTTMSFFHEMKTAIRTYHPVPALQKTSGSLQDAPRLKSILKALVLDSDTPKMATTLRDCRARIEAETSPPTPITNLIFILANESVSISKLHFASEVDFLDLFTQVQLSSKSRARAFLWLAYNYYEAGAIGAPNTSNHPESNTVGSRDGANPFSDPARPGGRPPLDELTEAEAALENIDPTDEIEISRKLVAQRMHFLSTQSPKDVSKGGKASAKDDESVISVDSAAKPRPKRRDLGKGKAGKAHVNDGNSIVDQTTPSRMSDSQYRSSPFRASPLLKKQSTILTVPAQRYSPYPFPQDRIAHRTVSGSRMSPPRTLLEHAWNTLLYSDPLADSDDEMADEYCRQDYVERLKIVCRLRGKEPTPEPT
ncbi:hypothetical protein D9757_006348 [Collybiopsis confluens]|uniref:Ino eighty subunit 1 n=1 Tax=Collybiopsis confluens TaxID=2823264 RepID=A0A8H5HGV3_9AGAR|nr:hypothetical protein D9757_006348 [Collybiopsis confluens]